MKRMACAVALAAGAGITGVSALPAIAAPNPATAASGLQVNVVPPGTVSGDATIPLDVKFHGGNIQMIELFVDGTRLTRQKLTTRDGRGVVHFSLDPTLLTEGSHEVLVKAYEADGSCATTTTQVLVAAGDLNALARFEWPKRNAEVQGVVPIKIKIDPSIMDPYVTYTVDNDFLAFRNYAPYIYNWDTAKAGNGIHAIGIEVMDGRTLQVVQKMTLAVNVKNVGGFTNIAQPDKTTGRGDKGSIVDAVQSTAESVAPDAPLSVGDTVLGLAGRTTRGPVRSHQSVPSGFKSNARLRTGGPRPNVAAVFSPDSQGPLDAALLLVRGLPLQGLVQDLPAIGAPSGSRPAPNPGGAHVAPGLAALAVDPVEVLPGAGRSTLGLARENVKFRQGTAIALRPGAVRRTVSMVPLPAFRTGAPTAAPRHGARVVAHMNRKTFDVAFNNSMVKFDVAPRVENGLPLAPFRAIFEHNGGTVKWNNEAKVVRAFDKDHEIEIKIGTRDARVNNVAVSMEAVPYLDHGRTIVPLSFVRDAMDLKVTFDQETGHLMIEKK